MDQAREADPNPVMTLVMMMMTMIMAEASPWEEDHPMESLLDRPR